jgi:hypothetical protein
MASSLDAARRSKQPALHKEHRQEDHIGTVMDALGLFPWASIARKPLG